MSSKIEQQIDQIEDYIDSCRYQKFSKSKSCVPELLRRSSTIRELSTTKKPFSRTQDVKRMS